MRSEGKPLLEEGGFEESLEEAEAVPLAGDNGDYGADPRFPEQGNAPTPQRPTERLGVGCSTSCSKRPAGIMSPTRADRDERPTR